jgi:hypothetical protein
MLVILLLPVALIAGLFSKGRKCTPEELASDLKKFADGTDTDGEWDHFESVPIQDPRLETIRLEALRTVHLPLQVEDRAKLAQLSVKAAALGARIFAT